MKTIIFVLVLIAVASLYARFAGIGSGVTASGTGKPTNIESIVSGSIEPIVPKLVRTESDFVWTNDRGLTLYLDFHEDVDGKTVLEEVLPGKTLTHHVVLPEGVKDVSANVQMDDGKMYGTLHVDRTLVAWLEKLPG